MPNRRRGPFRDIWWYNRVVTSVVFRQIFQNHQLRGLLWFTGSLYIASPLLIAIKGRGWTVIELGVNFWTSLASAVGLSAVLLVWASLRVPAKIFCDQEEQLDGLKSELAAATISPPRSSQFHLWVDALIDWGEQIEKRQFYGRPGLILAWFVIGKRLIERSFVDGQSRADRFWTQKLDTRYQLFRSGTNRVPITESDDRDLVCLRHGMEAMRLLRKLTTDPELDPSFTGLDEFIRPNSVLRGAVGDIGSEVLRRLDSMTDMDSGYESVRSCQEILVDVFSDEFLAEASSLFGMEPGRRSAQALHKWIHDNRGKMSSPASIRDGYFPLPIAPSRHTQCSRPA